MIIFISLILCCDCRITFALVEILKRVLNHACITTNPSTREAKSRQSRRCTVISEFCALSRFFLLEKEISKLKWSFRARNGFFFCVSYGMSACLQVKSLKTAHTLIPRKSDDFTGITLSLQYPIIIEEFNEAFVYLFIKLLIHFCYEPSGNTSKSNRKNTEAVFEFQRQETTTKKEKNIWKGFSPDMISFTARVENSCCCEINSRELNRNTQKTNSR